MLESPTGVDESMTNILSDHLKQLDMYASGIINPEPIPYQSFITGNKMFKAKKVMMALSLMESVTYPNNYRAASQLCIKYSKEGKLFISVKENDKIVIRRIR